MKDFLCHLLVYLMIAVAPALLLSGCGYRAAAATTEASAVQTEPTTVQMPTDPVETIAPSETTLPVPVCPLPLDDWRLQLINRDHPIDQEYKPELTHVRGDIYVDSRCYTDLTAMLEACRADGLSPLVCSGYRDLDYQTKLFNNKIQQLRAEGLPEDEAHRVAQTIVAIPGASEHHIGLAVDIVDQSYQQLNERQEQTAVQQWLIEHCWEYGFILRYPNGKSDITKIIYEPWHYRYVGKEIAAEIRDSGLCLEEYLAQFHRGYHLNLQDTA